MRSENAKFPDYTVPRFPDSPQKGSWGAGEKNQFLDYSNVNKWHGRNLRANGGLLSKASTIPRLDDYPKKGSWEGGNKVPIYKAEVL